MIKLKKLSALLLTSAMVASLFMPNITAKAEAATDLLSTEIKVNYAEETIEIESATDLGSVYVTDKYVKATETTPEKAIWDEYELKENSTKYVTEIDFSNYAPSATKDTVVYVKGDETVFPIKINKQDTSFKVKFSGTDKVKISTTETVTLTGTNNVTDIDSGYIYFTTASGSSISVLPNKEKVEWKKGASGVWSDITKLDLSDYTNRGVSLYFRLKASDATEITKDGEVYTNTGSRVSKEVKLSYVRKASAPAVTVDGAKYTIGLKAGQEYKVGTTGEWVDVKESHTGSNGKVSATLFDLYTEADRSAKFEFDQSKTATIYVRTKATDKKMASKVKVLTINQTEDASETAKIGDEAADLLTFKYVKPYDDASGLVIANSTNKVYQVAVVSTGAIMTDDTIDQTKVAKQTIEKKITWTTVKGVSATAATGSSIKVTISATTVNKVPKADRVIIYRLASIPEVAKTTAVEFRVASATESLDMPTPTQQAFLFADVTDKVSTENNVVTVKIATGTSIDLNATLENAVTTTGVKPTIKVVKAITSGAIEVTSAPTGVKLETKTYLTASKGAMKVTAAASAKASTSYWELKAEGATIYLTIIVGTAETSTP